MTLLVIVSLGSKLLLDGRAAARALLRRVASRRCGRCELSVVSAMLSLLREHKSLLASLAGHIKLRLEASLLYASDDADQNQ